MAAKANPVRWSELIRDGIRAASHSRTRFSAGARKLVSTRVAPPCPVNLAAAESEDLVAFIG
jgi:hypothetical protein